MTTAPVWEDMLYQGLAGSKQDPIWHAEGDVATHTKMVVAALQSHPEFGKQTPQDQDLLRRAALLHDIGKPSCTQFEGVRVRNRGHSKLGETLSRGLLYGEGYAPALREQVCALVRSHGIPMHGMDGPVSAVRPKILRSSLAMKNQHLAILAEADFQGRVSKEPTDTVEYSLDRFRELSKRFQCHDQVFKFGSDHAKFRFFRGNHEDPQEAPTDTPECEVILMSGLPGSGKDTWIQENVSSKLPVVSLDADIRAANGDVQGVLKATRAKMRTLLQAKQSFVFNARNTVADWRLPWISLAAEYNASVRIVYVEAPLRELLNRNASRPIEERISESKLYGALNDWSVPHASEAHTVEYHFHS